MSLPNSAEQQVHLRIPFSSPNTEDSPEEVAAKILLELFGNSGLNHAVIDALIAPANPDDNRGFFTLLVILDPQNISPAIREYAFRHGSFEYFSSLLITQAEAAPTTVQEELTKMLEQQRPIKLIDAYSALYGKKPSEHILSISDESISKNMMKPVRSFYYRLKRVFQRSHPEQSDLTLSMHAFLSKITLQDLIRTKGVGQKYILKMFEAIHEFDETGYARALNSD